LIIAMMIANQGRLSGKSLTVVGVGIRAGLETTPEAHAYIQLADKVLYLVGDPLAATWIESVNPTAESLGPLYGSSVKREEIYAAILDRIATWARRSQRLCVAFYGHPGVFSYIAHEAVRRGRLEGAEARMLPAISAADWLFADLGLDPGAQGCQSYEATTFLICHCRFDPCAALLLWQIGAIGDPTWPPNANPQCLRLLVEYLEPHYGADHEIVIYQAAWGPLGRPLVERLPLRQLPQARTSTGSTLYVPPRGPPQPNPQVLEKLDRSTLALLTAQAAN
jgi:hypothetical protein